MASVLMLPWMWYEALQHDPNVPEGPATAAPERDISMTSVSPASAEPVIMAIPSEIKTVFIFIMCHFQK